LYIVAALRTVLAIAALWALRRELSGVEIGTLLPYLRAFGWSHVALGLACTAASFLLLGFVELLALRHTDHAAGACVPVRAALGTAFVANALSQSVGVAVLTGAAVRARAYRRYGLDAVAIAQTTAFVAITATVGLLAAGGAALLAAPASVLVADMTIAVHPLGTLLGGIVVAYLAWSIVGRRDSVGFGRWQLSRPSPAMAGSQLVLSTIDWILAGTALFAFMPASPGLTLGVVLGAYMIAQTVAVTSHVPAGAGVFEVIVMALIMGAQPRADRSAVVAALVMFRVIYYLAPLCVAILVASVAELLRSRAGRRDVIARGPSFPPSRTPSAI
jgi:phosphatidylglycerol lysyltransferase